MAKFFISTGAFFAALGILLGAFGAHGLKNRLETHMLEVWHTGVNYHMYHALGLIFIGILLHQIGDSSLIKWSGRLMITGIILFSGSLYLLAFTGIKWLGAITPLGGISFITAWLLLSFALLRANY
ncbi:DUF423 domain-containing protein [Candidatus Nitrosacidococcus sp. I8]|uniref:DUF423 domain-containing protein n=1 Tax=Candidatus Nitrosacidococcus sp. I8 TaxID=2942908 RepID=UPI002225FE15|nr:DUF423 domain-containing protein [Candidatus Nitrosacidococcus sp. I8]CAH9018034.1 hypothetical protein NURINAE_00689 [Candidatus Nitrosacidococcus sp. I8]